MSLCWYHNVEYAIVICTFVFDYKHLYNENWIYFYNMNDRPLIISIIMYANTTFLGSIDRLSATNPLANTSRAICGVFGCIAYIIVVIVLYFGTVAAYLNGDYIQGSFVTLKHENNIMYSGCDFKLAISFS